MKQPLHLAQIVGVVKALLLPAQAVHVAHARPTGIRLDGDHLIGRTEAQSLDMLCIS